MLNSNNKKMKKAIVTLSAILLIAVSAYAGGDRTSNRYLYSRFSQNWFIDASGTLNAWNGTNRASFVDFNTLNYKNAAGDFGRFGGSLKIGKMVSPSVGLRLAVDMNQATMPYEGDRVFESVHADAMLSLMDWLGGYRDNRVYRMFLVGGFGMGLNAPDFFKVKGLNKEFMAFFGIMNNFRLGNAVDLHIDLNAYAPKWEIENRGHFTKYYVDLNLQAALGLTWYLGGRHFDICEACPEVDCPEANCDDKDRQIKNLNARIAELEAQGPTTTVVNGPCDTIVKFVDGETAPFSIFFNRDSYQLRDNRDAINLAEIAKVAKDKGYKINLRGTCDSATASAEYNKKLAENRCRKVKDELVKCGVSESNIIVDAVGGVSELKPAELDRRVLITFSK